MINKSVSFFEGLASDLGLSIKIPHAGRTLLEVSAVTNGVIGASLVIAGSVISSKALICIGALGLAGAAVLAMDEERV